MHLALLAIALLSAPSSSFEVQVLKSGKPVSGQEVEAVGFSAGVQKLQSTKKTDASGRVRFQVPASENPINLLVRTASSGLQAVSNPLVSTNLPAKPVILEIFETSEDLRPLNVSILRLFFSLEKSNLRVEQHFVVENPTSKVITLRPGGQGNVRFSLPDGAFQPQFDEGFDENDTRIEGKDIVSDRPLSPGLTHFSLSYLVEVKARSFDFQQKWNVAVQNVRIATRDERLVLNEKADFQSSQKYFDGQFISVFSKALNAPELRMSLSGFPFALSFRVWLPLFLLAIFGVLAWFLRPQQGLQALDSAQKERLLEELSRLRTLREAQAITEQRFESRRLQLLESLIPYYAK